MLTPSQGAFPDGTDKASPALVWIIEHAVHCSFFNVFCAGTPLKSREYRRHRVALERWRDAFAAFLASQPNDSAILYSKVEDLTAAADKALEVACYSIAAQNENGTNERGLSGALPVLVRKNARLEQERRDGRIFPIAQMEFVVNLVEDDSGVLGEWSQCAVVPPGAEVDETRWNFWGGLLDTIECAIEDLKERESGSSSTPERDE